MEVRHARAHRRHRGRLVVHLRALPSLAQYPDAELVAIADPDEERLNRAGDAFDVVRRYTSHEAMLDNERLDGVVVATPHTTHYDLARTVLSRGLGLMLEKPM